MAQFLVSGAGDTTYNGLYLDAGTYSGHPYYQFGTGGAARYLYHLSGISLEVWNLGATLGGLPAYTGTNHADLPANPWSGATAPAPSLTSYTPDISGPTNTLIVAITAPDAGTTLTTSTPIAFTVSGFDPYVFGTDVLVDVELLTESLGNSTGGTIHGVVNAATDVLHGVLTLPLNGLSPSGATVITVRACYDNFNGLRYVGYGQDTRSFDVEVATTNPKPTVSLDFQGRFPTVNLSGVRWAYIQANSGNPDAGVVHLSRLDFLIDGVIVQSDLYPSPSLCGWSFHIDTRTLTDGPHTFGALATNNDGNTATDNWPVTVANGGNGGGGGTDTTAPTVSINTPSAGDSVSGVVDVSATITDAGSGVARATLYVDGLPQATLTPAAVSSTAFAWDWDTRLSANGTYVLRIDAYDVAGNMGTATVTVTVTNSLADLTRVRYTVQMVADDFPLNWTERLKDLLIEVPLINPDDVPVDPTRQYNLNVYFASPGATADYTQMDLVTPFRSHAPATPGALCRWALVGTPRQVWATWTSDSLALIKLATLANGNIIALATGPAQLLELKAAGFVQWADLAGLTVTDMVAFGGKVFVAAGTKLKVYDQDTGDLEWDATLAADVTSIDLLAEGPDSALYVACTVTGGTGRVYTYTWGALRVLATHSAPLTRLLMVGTTLYAGDGAGKVLRLSGAAFVTEYDTAQAGGVTALGLGGTNLYAGTGAAGKVYAEVGAWTEVGDLTWAHLHGFATFQGWTYLFGPSPDLYREDAAGAWAKQFTLTNCTEVNDALVATVSGVERLYLATSNATATAQLKRLEIAPAGQLVTGPDCPDLDFQALVTSEA
jgi:hypothetical protein